MDYITYRTKCGRGRVSYHPEWSESQPWVTYIDGTAGRHVVDLPAAHSYFRAKGMELVNPLIQQSTGAA